MEYKNAEIKPINGYILVEKKIDASKDTNLVLPETAQEKAGIMELRIIAVDDEEKVLKVGDIVKMMSITKIGVFKYKEDEFMMVNREEVGCVIREVAHNE